MKIALISDSLPPSNSGQSVVLSRMLGGVSADGYCLISQTPHAAAGAGAAENGNGLRGEWTRRLPGKYFHLPAGFRLTRGHRFGLAALRGRVNIPLAVAQHSGLIADIVRREGCDAVVACTGAVSDLPAAYRASRRTGVPFFAYVFDDYTYREWHDPAARFWAERYEPSLMRGAAGVIVPNEVLRDDLRRRYSVEATVIHNSFDIAPYAALPDEPRPRRGGGAGAASIVYTGDIYEAHFDAFRNLVAAVKSLGRAGLELHLYTSRAADYLAAQGIEGPVRLHPQRPAEEVPRVQREADLLFLPLAFDSPYPEVVRTSATTKLGEYMAARRPVLVHAPADSFVAWYFREHRCGVVVDRPDAGLLARAIESVLDDEGERRRLGERAWERARDDFNIDDARSKFWGLLGARGGAPAARLSS